MVDYSKWNRFVRETADDEELQDGEKDWSDMRPDERKTASKQAEESERRLEESRREHSDYVQSIVQDVENEGEAWMHDVDPESYEDFTIKRVWRVVKARGARLFKAGKLDAAEHQWLGALQLVQRVGLEWPSASDLYVQLKCNLAQVYLKNDRWQDARRAASAALEREPTCEKALYRRALVYMHFADWYDARRDLEALLASHPKNVEAQKMLAEANTALRKQFAGVRRPLTGQAEGCAANLELSNAMEDLTDEGTLRKICVLVPGRDQLTGEDLRWVWPWGREEWLGGAREKAVLSVHTVVRSVGGEELYNTRGRLVLPENPQQRDALREQMRHVAELDDKAGKSARTPGDFCEREVLQPLRWRYGDPCMYVGLDLAARSMRLGERALFEIDQPLLEPSVRNFYRGDGMNARAAGLPNFKHHVEERKLNVLAEELPEWELDLDNKIQRSVRVDLELVALELYKDLSPEKTGAYLLRIAQPGRGKTRLRSGVRVRGDFAICGALDGKMLYRVDRAEWIIGQEGQESSTSRQGGRTTWIPACVGSLLRDANWTLLYERAKLEARLQVGPAPMELNPKMAADLYWKRAWGHKPPAAISVHITKVLDD